MISEITLSKYILDICYFICLFYSIVNCLSRTAIYIIYQAKRTSYVAHHKVRIAVEMTNMYDVPIVSPHPKTNDSNEKYIIIKIQILSVK